MGLQTYREKRDFKSTAEPRGGRARKGGNSFCIQKHDATRLHYDFRLEMDGVLKSWAVTRGPSLDTQEKRLAVQTEDHPLEYGDFEGTIPEGEYGGGTVMLWDRGTWTPVFDAKKGFAKGHLEFELEGEKLKGRWHLVRMQRRRGEKHDNWLLIKGDDEFARADSGEKVLEDNPKSVKTGRDLGEIAKEAPGWSSKTGKIERKPAARTSKASGAKPANNIRKPGSDRDVSNLKGTRKSTLPDFVSPALATLVAKAPSGDNWLHEIKFDGYRLQARIEDGRVKLLTRKGLDWTAKFGEALCDALAGLPVKSALIDGEVVVEEGGGPSNFSALQADLSDGRSDRFTYYAFDLMHLDGRDLRKAKLSERKAVLEGLMVIGDGPLRFSNHFTDSGETVKAHACKLGLEGIISKNADDPYPDGRSKSWLKAKCSDRQEVVIAGFVPSTVDRKLVGSLVMGVYEDGRLRHAGRVGTGYTRTVAADLFKKLDATRQDKSPFAEKLPAIARRGVVFVKPELVAEIDFRGWSSDRLLRHASFQGLREDKPAMEVVREMPKSAEPTAVQTSADLPAIKVKLSHPERIYWPEDGVTKQGLAGYYAQVWSRMEPFIVGRALALLRCPGGIDGQCFFQKHVWKGANKNIKLFKDPQGGDDEPLVTVSGFDGLIGLVQAGVLEIHPWGSKTRTLEKPDMMIMDLDPGDGVSWNAIVEAAKEVRQRFEDKGLAAFVKTSGGKGLHVVAPLKPSADWDTVKAFSKQMAEAMAKDSPDKYVSVVTKAKRKGKILIDYLRNGRNATAVAAYSTRARKGAAVSMPIFWEELDSIKPDGFTVENAAQRLTRLEGDPWVGFFEAAKPLPKAGQAKRTS